MLFCVITSVCFWYFLDFLSDWCEPSIYWVLLVIRCELQFIQSSASKSAKPNIIRIPPSFVHPTIFNFHGHNFIGNNISNRIYGWSDNLSFHIPHISPQMLFQCDYLNPSTVSLPGITFDEFIFVKTSWIIFLSSFVQNLQKFDNYWHPSNFIALVNTMLKCTNFQFHFEYEMCN